jgi:hypothetical protein
MKKCLWGILICLAGIPAFGIDLTTYPGAINKGTVLLNIGAGYGANINPLAKTLVPPVMVNADFALPIGGLPFSLGLTAVFSGEYEKHTDVPFETDPSEKGNIDINYYIFGVGGRFSYHFNWDVNRLDTYMTLTMGFLLNSWNGTIEPPKNLAQNNKNDSASEFKPFWGLQIGGRYFFVPHFGVFLDLGYTRLTVVSMGLSFKL